MEIQTLIISVEQTARALSTTKQTIYALHAADPSFPRIFKLGKRKSGLLYSELESWLQNRRKNHRIESRIDQSQKMDGAA